MLPSILGWSFRFGKTPESPAPETVVNDHVVTNVIPQPENHSIFISMFELFTIGTWLFWLSVIIFSLIAMGCSERDDKGGVLAIATVIFFACFGKSLYATLSAVSVMWVLVGIGIYIVIGAIWTIIKWWLHCKQINLRIKEFKPSSDSNAAYTNSNTLEFFRASLNPVRNKSRITTWGVYWPWSMIWSAIHDTVDMVYQGMLNWYRSIARGSMNEIDIIEKSLRK